MSKPWSWTTTSREDRGEERPQDPIMGSYGPCRLYGPYGPLHPLLLHSPTGPWSPCTLQVVPGEGCGWDIWLIDVFLMLLFVFANPIYNNTANKDNG